MKQKVVILNDKDKYLVVNELISGNHLFCQIIKIDSDEDFILVEKINDEFFVIKNEKLKKSILSEMYKNISKK